MRKRNLVALGIALVVALAIMYVLSTSPRRNLDRFLKEVATVEIGKTKLDDWRKHLERAHLANVNVSCKDGGCSVECTEENTLLQRLRLAPQTTVWCFVSFGGGVADQIGALIHAKIPEPTSHEFIETHVFVVLEGNGSEPCRPHYRARAVSGGTVFMSPCVLPQDRARAFAINTSCLTRIGGCKTVESMLPQVFAHP